MAPPALSREAALQDQPKKGTYQIVLANSYLFGVACFSSLGGFLFGYDQGVVSGILTMESFGVAFPRIYLNSGFKGWFVSTLLLAAWFGSLANGPIADRFGRKKSIMMAIVIFTIGSAIQAGGVSVAMIFVGRAIAGLAIGVLTMVVPLYMAEVSLPEIRGGLVVLQQHKSRPRHSETELHISPQLRSPSASFSASGSITGRITSVELVVPQIFLTQVEQHQLEPLTQGQTLGHMDALGRAMLLGGYHSPSKFYQVLFLELECSSFPSLLVG